LFKKLTIVCLIQIFVSVTEHEVTILTIWRQFTSSICEIYKLSSLVTKQAPKSDQRSWYWHYRCQCHRLVKNIGY